LGIIGEKNTKRGLNCVDFFWFLFLSVRTGQILMGLEFGTESECCGIQSTKIKDKEKERT